MNKISAHGEQLDYRKRPTDGKIWKKPALIQLNVKQTLSVGSGCPAHQHEVNGVCVDR